MRIGDQIYEVQTHRHFRQPGSYILGSDHNFDTRAEVGSRRNQDGLFLLRQDGVCRSEDN
jgi:hypothetical protein